MTGAREDPPAGSQQRRGQSWRTFSMLCGCCFPTVGALCAPELENDPLPPLLAAPPVDMSRRLRRFPGPGYAFAPGAFGSGAGPREPGGGDYRDNLSTACGKQPLGCRLFAFVNLMLEVCPFLPRCRFLPRASGRLEAAFASYSRGTWRQCVRILRSLTTPASRARPECRGRKSGLSASRANLCLRPVIAAPCFLWEF